MHPERCAFIASRWVSQGVNKARGGAAGQGENDATTSVRSWVTDRRLGNPGERPSPTSGTLSQANKKMFPKTQPKWANKFTNVRKFDFLINQLYYFSHLKLYNPMAFQNNGLSQNTLIANKTACYQKSYLVLFLIVTRSRSVQSCHTVFKSKSISALFTIKFASVIIGQLTILLCTTVNDTAIRVPNAYPFYN